MRNDATHLAERALVQVEEINHTLALYRLKQERDSCSDGELLDRATRQVMRLRDYLLDIFDVTSSARFATPEPPAPQKKPRRSAADLRAVPGRTVDTPTHTGETA